MSSTVDLHKTGVGVRSNELEGALVNILLKQMKM